MRRTTSLSVVITSVISAMILVGCGGGGASTPADEPLGDPATRVDLGMRDVAYVPETVEARAGEIVEIALSNIGSLPHDFTIDAIEADLAVTEPAGRVGRSGSDVHVALDGRRSTVAQLRVTTPGTYTFYCTVSGHRAAGMEGTLVVSE